jgi:hypothetical protein
MGGGGGGSGLKSELSFSFFLFFSFWEKRRSESVTVVADLLKKIDLLHFGLVFIELFS